VADAETRQALGPPPPSEPPVPPPAAINAKAIDRRPADPIEGAPYVTAKAWAIADGKTGAMIEGMDEAKRVEPASTTKVMTARVVLNLAKADPAVLDEIVTFSERADRTPGSTAGVKAGEKLPVRELLYGLLLPSGNDGAAALAEHFGARVGSGDEQDPRIRFVDAMNREAAALNLNETHFENPHGLPAAEHLTSARDLARLASRALADPTFAAIVNTPQRGCTLATPDGMGRNVVWSNTNRLLQTEGYDGVKTGTTTGAGACLIASGRRDGEHRIVVVLGSGSSDARYADARNLFRWAWRRGGTR
jgi:D-alanyl-D-alanine carboxypeptidase (penicillin-binding protein 5/6)